MIVMGKPREKLEKDIDAELATSLSLLTHCETDEQMEQLAHMSREMPALASGIKAIFPRISELVGKPRGFKVPIYEYDDVFRKAHGSYTRNSVSVQMGSRKGVVSVLQDGLKRRQIDEMGVKQRIKTILSGDEDDVFR